MRRRLLILAASFGLLLLILATFQLFNMQSGQMGPDQPGEVSGALSEEDRIVFKAHIRDEAEGNEAGQLRMIIVAPECHRRNDGIYVMYNPCVEVRDIGGGRLYATADVAEMNLQPAGESYKLISARFYSNDGRRSVRVYFDRAPTEDNPTFRDIASSADEIAPIFDALDERRADMIRLYAEDLTYHEDSMEATSDGTLIIYAAEADMAGQGLLVRWNEQPSELRRLQINEGQSIRLYNLAGGENFIAMPGEETPETTEDVTEEDLVASTEEQTDEDDLPVVAPTPDPGPVQDDEVRPTRNQYYARFHDDVAVQAGTRRLWGADTLTLEFELDDAARESLQNQVNEETGEEAARMEENGFDFVAGRWADTPDMILLGDTPEGQETQEEDEDDLVSQFMGDDEFGTPEKPVVISWRGALEVEPTGYTPDANPENYTVTAVGNDVHLEDRQFTGFCHRAQFRNPARELLCEGTPDRPVRAYLTGGQELACHGITFDVQTGRANLAGPGMIRMDSGEPNTAAAQSDDPFGSMAGGGSVNWQEEAVATIGTDEETGDQYLRYAILTGDVVLTQDGPEMVALPADLTDEEVPDYNFLRCDQMEVWLDPGEGEFQMHPTAAETEGNMIAHLEGNVIRAESGSAFFAAQPAVAEEDEDSSEDGEDQQDLEFDISVITAQGNVRVTDISGAEQPIAANADEVRANVAEKIVVLFGTAEEPAEIYQGENVLRGEEIRLNQNTFSAVVDGYGEMRFVTDTDLNGNTLDEPMPMDIDWTDRMEYQGQRNDVSFAGDVHMINGGNSVQCGHLRLLLEQAEDEGDEGGESAEGETVAEAPVEEDDESPAFSRGLGLSIERYGSRELTMIIASENVEILSRRENEAGQLVGRMKVTARERLMYDAPVNEISIFGRGTLLVEDYEIDTESGEPRMRTDSTGNLTLQGPSQTAVIWTDEVRLEQDTRRAHVSGEVRMIHRSGNEIRDTENLNVPDWGELDTGQQIMANCDDLVVVFAPPEEAPDEEPAAVTPDEIWESGPALGPLESFVATGRVNMQDGRIQVIGEQVTYSRAEERALVVGYLPGQPVANASLVYDDPETGAYQSYSRPRMDVFMEDGQVVEVLLNREP
jgi:lipopolysaccharide export system protein LptA